MVRYPILVIELVFERSAKKLEELVVVPGTSQMDLYDQVGIISSDTIQEFFGKDMRA